MNHAFTPQQASPPPNDDEIDLRQVAAALNRQRRLIAGISAAAVLLSGIYAFTRKPVWQGEFQIVLENQQSGEVAAWGNWHPQIQCWRGWQA